jgi:hypothetical protein
MPLVHTFGLNRTQTKESSPYKFQSGFSFFLLGKWIRRIKSNRNTIRPKDYGGVVYSRSAAQRLADRLIAIQVDRHATFYTACLIQATAADGVADIYPALASRVLAINLAGQLFLIRVSQNLDHF